MKIFRVQCDIAPGKEGMLDRLLIDKVQTFWLNQPGVRGFHIYGYTPTGEGDAKPTRTLLIEIEDQSSIQQILDSDERKQLREEMYAYTLNIQDELPFEERETILVDEVGKKTALRMIAHGIYILGVRVDGELNAGTVTWLSQCSFKPPLIMMGLKRNSSLHEPVKRAGFFAISFLNVDQADIARAMFKSAKVEDGSINGIAYHIGETGAPIISESPAWIECRLAHVYEGGDHSVVVGEVISADAVDGESPVPLLLKDMGLNYGG